ncbi:MAG: chromosomal replication initiator protein DnaA, partial [Acidimicrobiales bacterium]
MTEAQQLWNACSSALRSQVSEATWKAWFSGIEPVAVVSGELVLSVPSAVVRDRLEGRFSGMLHDAVVDASGKDYPIRYDVNVDEVVEAGTVSRAGYPHETTWPGELIGAGADPSLLGTSSTAPNTQAPSSHSGTASARHGADKGHSSDVPLNPRYTFDAYVTGPSNRFSYAAALSVAEGPAKSYNPLYIYGGVGLGKTHLLQAIGNYVTENFARLRVRYVSTETFLNEFVETIRAKHDMGAFRRRYRECDVLLIDDVQFMENKDSLQEELFHTFNSLYGASKQIVITSDRPAKALATLEERLRSRLLSGLTTHVEPPEIETRIAILRTKAEREKLVAGDDVLEFIAAN